MSEVNDAKSPKSVERSARTSKPKRGRRGGKGPKATSDEPAPPARKTPEPGIPVARAPSTRTVLLNDSRSKAELFDQDVDTIHPINIRPQFHVDAAGLFDILDSSYRNLIAIDPKLSNTMPKPLYVYYVTQMFWYRALYVLRNNNIVDGRDEETFMRVLDAAELWVPTEISQWLTGLGNTMTSAGDNLLLSIAYHVNQHGHFGEYATDTAYRYAVTPAPSVAAQLIRNTLRNDRTAAPLSDSAWAVDGITPATHAHRWVGTPNLLGWYRLNPSTKRGTSAMLNLGWTEDADAPDVRSRYKLSMGTMQYVSSVLEQLGNKHSCDRFANETSNGFTAQIPWLSLQCDELDLRQRSSARETRWLSRFNCDSSLVSSSYLLGYRFERPQNEGCTRSPAYPFAYGTTDAQGWFTIQDYPWQADVNQAFNFGVAPAYINGAQFIGAQTLRSDNLATLPARFNRSKPSQHSDH